MNVESRNSLSLPATGLVTDTGLELPDNLPVETWQGVGLQIARLRGATQWWIGDWWAYAEHKYGDRKALVESEEWDGPAFQTCVNASNVCQKFTSNRRRLVLTFNHHAEVAALPEDWQDNLLDEAEVEYEETGKHMSIARLRQRVKEVKVFLAQGWTPDQIARQHRVMDGYPVVASMRKGAKDQPVDNALIEWADANERLVRIDRQSDFGNPFILDEDGDRDEVLANFEWYLDRKPSLLKKIPALAGKVLLCWCYPKRCHGNILCERVPAPKARAQK